MHRTKHAQEITQRFQEMVENAGNSLPAEHYKELALLIEAGIDTALVGYIEKMASRIENLAHEMRHDAEFFD